MSLFAGCPKVYDLVEFFAGCSNTTFAFRKRGYRAARLDLKYSKRRRHHRTDYMDLNSATGFLLLGPVGLAYFVFHTAVCVFILIYHMFHTDLKYNLGVVWELLSWIALCPRQTCYAKSRS